LSGEGRGVEQVGQSGAGRQEGVKGNGGVESRFESQAELERRRLKERDCRDQEAEFMQAHFLSILAPAARRLLPPRRGGGRQGEEGGGQGEGGVGLGEREGGGERRWGTGREGGGGELLGEIHRAACVGMSDVHLSLDAAGDSLSLAMYQSLSHTQSLSVLAMRQTAGGEGGVGMRVVSEEMMCRLWAETYLIAYLSNRLSHPVPAMTALREIGCLLPVSAYVCHLFTKISALVLVHLLYKVD
jgi:hypothetical protein